MVDRLRNVLCHVERDIVRHPVRKILADSIHLGLYILGHFNGVGAGKHIHVQHRGVSPVDTALCIIRLGLKRHTSHILDADYGPVGIGAKHYVFKIRHSRKTSLGSNRHGNLHPVGWRAPELPGRRFAVLVFQCFLYVLHS